MDPFAQFKKTYFEECAELLESAQQHLNDLQEGNGSGETLHAIFRAVHSIKGGAGSFGFKRLVGVAHALETLLDAMREGKLEPRPDTVKLLLRATDSLSDIIAAKQREEIVPENFAADIVEALEEALGKSRSHDEEADSNAKSESSVVESTGTYRIRFSPRAEIFQKANEPLLILRELRKLGALSAQADLSKLPPLNVMKAEDAYIAWNLSLTTTASRKAVEEVFEFVSDDCELHIEADGVQDGNEPTPVSRADFSEQTPVKSADRESANGAARLQSIRVDIEKVDRLVNLVGELVITQAMLSQQSDSLSVEQFPSLIQGIEALSQHARELQESVMAIRAQPVKSVFARMPRLVRELASALGKDIKLVTTGENTEIDKTVIEQLSDPLTHMIRNSVDHGIERPEERSAAGKPACGVISLSAEHRSGRIVIEISDDGRGINRERVLRKAKEKGLISADANLSDDEIDNLIFLPGFSTAESVSNISGRGVGMDVVKRNIQALGGRIALQSKQGAGSRFILSLPLTLAVLDGMVVAVGPECYVIPLTHIIESLRPKPKNIYPLVGRGHVLSIRGAYVPLVFLHQYFDVKGAVTDPSRAIVVLVETESHGRIGLVVDELIGQQQVVVKSLEANYDPVAGVSAATILGNGRVALIIDVAALETSVPSSADGMLTLPGHVN